MFMAGQDCQLLWHLHPCCHWLWHMLCPQCREQSEGVRIQSPGDWNARAKKDQGLAKSCIRDRKGTPGCHWPKVRQVGSDIFWILLRTSTRDDPMTLKDQRHHSLFWILWFPPLPGSTMGIPSPEQKTSSSPSWPQTFRRNLSQSYLYWHEFWPSRFKILQWESEIWIFIPF